jgi:phosphoribosylformylglycinamidine (FGAM) synthase PurS component
LNHFEEMLQRANLQNISNLLQIGCIKNELDNENLEKREDEAVKVLEQRLENLVSGSFYDEVVETAMKYANDCCEVYFTVGMKAGARVIFQLLNDSLNDT